MDELTLESVLFWLVTGGSVVLVSWITSWAFEGLAFWDNLGAKVKRTIILAAAIVIGLGARAVMNLPEETLAVMRPYTETVLLVISAWLSTQVAHALNPERKDTTKKTT